MNYRAWIVNLENYAARVAEDYGKDTVYRILSKYNARTVYDLSPLYFDDVFGELEALLAAADD